MNFHIITLFPESFGSYINSSIIGRAVRDKKIKVKFYNPRDFAKPSASQKKKAKPYLRVDNIPYGGGPGMVMEAMPVIKAVEKALRSTRHEVRGTKKNRNSLLVSRTLIVWLSPSGKQFSNDTAEKISKKYSDVIVVCGRYEGIDERAKKIIKSYFVSRDSKLDLTNLSVGPYVLTGGELPAMVIMDAVARRMPGVLGKIESVEENRVSSPEVYTRPEVLIYKDKKYKVPKVLLSGNHAKISEWRSRKRK